jgi:hypothetical protein
MPLFVWLTLFIYTFFPHPSMFNFEGRIFILNLFKKVFKNPWAPTLFRDSFLFSNIESLRTPI